MSYNQESIFGNRAVQNDFSQAERCELIQRHIEFAKRLARRFCQERAIIGIEEEEYEASALLGLVDAAWKFDPNRNNHFQTYSYFRIRGAMFDLVRRGGWNARGCHLSVLEPTLSKSESAPAFEEEENEDHFYTVLRSAEELASILATIEELNCTLIVGRPDGALEDAEICYSDKRTPEEIALSQNLKDYLCEVMSELNEQENAILRLYYFEGLTFEAMRLHFQGVSKSWISRLHQRALHRLRIKLQIREQACLQKLQEECSYEM